jgi:hypothetical protein
MHGRSEKPAGPAAPVRLLPAFDELRDQLDNGDLVLFAGTSRFSHAIKRLTRCHWSHVALVARVAGGPPLLWEATLDTDLPDLVTGEIAPGVNLYDLEGWIRHYAGETAIRRLSVERTDAMRQALHAFYLEARGRPYERNRLELLRAVFDGPLSRENETNLDRFFCSELVAEAYQRMGLLEKRPASNEYVPGDFSPERAEPLELLLGATLGEVVWVYRPE